VLSGFVGLRLLAKFANSRQPRFHIVAWGYTSIVASIMCCVNRLELSENHPKPTPNIPKLAENTTIISVDDAV